MSTTLARTREDVLAPIAAAFEEAAPDGGGAEFVARYFRHVPLDELTSRTADIYAGAAASHLELARHRLPGRGQRARLQPEHRGRRLVERAHRHPDRHRRHALPRRLGDRCAGQRRHRHPPDRAPPARREPRRRRRARAGRAPRRHRQEGQGRRRRGGRVVDAALHRPRERRGPPGRCSMRTVRDVLEDVRQSVEDWPKMRSKCLVLAAELEGSPPPGRRRRRDRARHPLPALDGRRPLHLPGLSRLHAAADRRGRVHRADHRFRAGPAALRPAARPRPRPAHPAGLGQGARAEHPGAHQGQHPLHRAPGHPPRLRRGEAVRRGRRGGRRAPVPGAVRVHGLHRVGDAGAAGRREGARRARALRAWPPTATPARTCSGCSRATRATS